MRSRLASLALLLVLPAIASAVEVESVLLPPASGRMAAPQALRLAEAAAVAPLAVLAPARVGAADQLQAIAAWNRDGRVPARNGVVRPLPLPRPVRLTAALVARGGSSSLAGGALLRPPGGGLVWAAEVRVENAWRLRLHLADVRLPPGAGLWVYPGDGGAEVFVQPQAHLRDGGLWTPSVAGPVVRVEVSVPAGQEVGAGFTVDQVLELLPLDEQGAPVTRAVAGATLPPCLVDGACAAETDYPGLEVLRRAVARIEFVLGGTGYLCTGGLLNDADPTTTVPYLLTAHHCIRDADSATSVEAFFDYGSAGCGGAVPDLTTLPRAVGASLLASHADSDYSLLNLWSLPPGRGMLGWSSEPITTALDLYRVSHPMGLEQQLSSNRVLTTGPVCGAWPRGRYLYSQRGAGGVFGGSSGSPVVRRSDGKLVGQLTGICGPAASRGDGCSNQNYVADGAFAASWPGLAPYLAPTQSGICVPSGSTLCLGAGDRFRVEARYQVAGGAGTAAHVVPLSDETGLLWFFAEGNVEAMVKLIDGCAVNDRFWVFAAGLTDVNVTLTVTDTVTGAVRSYVNPAGKAFQPVQDTLAFDCR
jgi:lysyl endopeptidase